MRINLLFLTSDEGLYSLLLNKQFQLIPKEYRPNNNGEVGERAQVSMILPILMAGRSAAETSKLLSRGVRRLDERLNIADGDKAGIIVYQKQLQKEVDPFRRIYLCIELCEQGGFIAGAIQDSIGGLVARVVKRAAILL